MLIPGLLFNSSLGFSWKETRISDILWHEGLKVFVEKSSFLRIALG
jgi:hypothetical protein